MGVVLRQAWSKSQWTVSQQMLDAIKHHSALVHCACNTFQLLQHSTNTAFE